MQRIRNVVVVAVWVLILLCDGVASSDESCSKTTTITTTTTTTTTTTVPGACGTNSAPLTKTETTKTETLSTPRASEKRGHKKSEVDPPVTKLSAPSTTSETNITPPASEKGPTDTVAVSAAQGFAGEPDIAGLPVGAERSPRSERRKSVNVTSPAAKLYGSWKVLAGYSRELITTALCPNLTFYFDPEDSNTITVTWSKAGPYEHVIPQGEMTMKDAGRLVDKSGSQEVAVIKLDKFLVLRVRNPHFWRAFVLARESQANEVHLGEFLDYMMHMDTHLQDSDGPAWYICHAAFNPELSSGIVH